MLVFSAKDHGVVVGLYAGFKTFEGETVNSNFERLLAHLTDICEKSDGLLIGGDFNAEPGRQGNKSTMLDLWQTNCGLDQLVNESTRHRLVAGTFQSSMIDHIYVKELPSISVRSVTCEVSDHNLLVAQKTNARCEKGRNQKEGCHRLEELQSGQDERTPQEQGRRDRSKCFNKS